jgi:hypothetical protein
MSWICVGCEVVGFGCANAMCGSGDAEYRRYRVLWFASCSSWV